MLIPEITARNLVEDAYKKFKGDCKGKFRKYKVGDQHFVVYFEEDNVANVLAYEDAMNIAPLAEKLKEIEC